MAQTMVRRVLMQLATEDADAEARLDSIIAKADELSAMRPELKPKIDSASAQAQMRVLRDELKQAATVTADVEDADAVAKIAELKAMLLDLDDRAGAIKVKADDKEAELSLLRVRAQLASLSEKVADPKIRISGVARAEADLAAVDLEIDRIKAKADKSGSGGLLGRILLGSGGSGGLLGGVKTGLSLLPGVNLGGAGGGAGGAEAGGAALLSPEGLAAGAGAVAALLPVIGAAVTEADALAAGLAAAGAGAGAFALLAYPAFSKVSSAYQQISADHAAYDRALTKTARNTALTHLHQDLAALSPTERGAIDGIHGLAGEYDKLSRAFEPQVFKIFNQGLQLASELLPKVTPFASTFAGGLGGLLGTAGRAAGSKGFDSFLGSLHKIEGPALGAIASGLERAAPALGRLLTVMSGRDVAHGITIAMDAIVIAIDAVTDVVKISMYEWDQFTADLHLGAHVFDDVRRGYATFGHDVAHVFDDVRHAVAEFGHDTAHAFDDARHDVAVAGHDIAHVFDDLRHDVAHAVDATVQGVERNWRLIVASLVNPPGTAVKEIRDHWHQLTRDTDEMRHQVAHVFDEIRHDVSAWADAVPHEVARAWALVRHDTAAAGDWLVHEVRSAFDAGRHAIATALDWARHYVASSWDSMRHSTATGADTVLHFFERLPGEVVHILGRLPLDLEQAGESAISGLIRGLEAEASKIPSVMGGIAKDVESFFTDPLGIHSPSTVFIRHGQENIDGALALGLERGLPRIRQASGKLAQAVTLGHPSGSLAVAGAGDVRRLQLEFIGGANDPLWMLFKKNIRIRGGNIEVIPS